MRVDVGDPVRGMKLMGVNELCVWSDKQIRNYRVNMVVMSCFPSLLHVESV